MPRHTEGDYHGGLARQTQDIVLISEANRMVGAAQKDVVHRCGLLHRAFSIFLTDAEGRFLLQRRSRSKYHSGGLWSNSCCGHPRPGERVLTGARRRVFEELGVTANLTFRFYARYSVALNNNMYENELVYVYSGPIKNTPVPDPDEIEEIKYLSFAEIGQYIHSHPQEISYWMRHYFKAHWLSMEEISASVEKPLGYRKP